jgi:hypothetical protein
MAIHIIHDTMTLKTGNRVVAAARFSQHAAGDCNGAPIVSTRPPGCSPRPGDYGIDNRRAGESGYSNSHPPVVALREELR